MDALADEMEAHREAQQEHEATLTDWMKKQDEIMIFVKNNLIPAYEREVNADNAKKWIKEQAKSGSFWIGVFMSIIAAFWAIIFIVKQASK